MRRWSTRTRRRAGPLRRLVLTLSFVAGAVSLVVRGAFATFTGSVSASQSVTSGTVSLGFGATNQLTLSSTQLRPGSTVYEAADLNVAGTADVASITFATTATTSSVLDTDATNGLQMKIDVCTGGTWNMVPTPPTCGGTSANALPQRAIIGSKLTLSNVSVSAGATNHLLFTFSLPTSSPSTAQGASSTIQYQFNANQRAAGSQ